MDRSEQLDLIRRFRSGDQAAFRTLLERFDGVLERRIRRSLPKSLRRRVTTQDVLQETCLAAYRGRAHFKTDAIEDFRRWLLAIADNKIRDLVRHHLQAQRRSRGREVTKSRRSGLNGVHAGTTMPDDAIARSERRARLRSAIENLPEDYQEVLRLTRKEHLSLREAAQRMGRSREATKKLYTRAIAKLRDSMRPDETRG